MGHEREEGGGREGRKEVGREEGWGRIEGGTEGGRGEIQLLDKCSQWWELGEGATHHLGAVESHLSHIHPLRLFQVGEWCVHNVHVVSLATCGVVDTIWNHLLC